MCNICPTSLILIKETIIRILRWSVKKLYIFMYILYYILYEMINGLEWWTHKSEELSKNRNTAKEKQSKTKRNRTNIKKNTHTPRTN